MIVAPVVQNYAGMHGPTGWSCALCDHSTVNGPLIFKSQYFQHRFNIKISGGGFEVGASHFSHKLLYGVPDIFLRREASG